jgi:hypothetical protein
MGATIEEQAAFEAGFAEMLLAIKAGDFPTHSSVGEKLETLFDLAKKSERVAVHHRAANLEIDRTVSTERTCAQIPVQRFMGGIAALLSYSKACRDRGVMPGDHVKFG